MQGKKRFLFQKMSYISLLFGLVRKEKKIKPDLPKTYGASQYIRKLPYIRNEDPNFKKLIIDIVDIVNNRSDLGKSLLATSDYGKIFRKVLTQLLQMENLIRLLYVEH